MAPPLRIPALVGRLFEPKGEEFVSHTWLAASKGAPVEWLPMDLLPNNVGSAAKEQPFKRCWPEQGLTTEKYEKDVEYWEKLLK